MNTGRNRVVPEARPSVFTFVNGLIFKPTVQLLELTVLSWLAADFPGEQVFPSMWTYESLLSETPSVVLRLPTRLEDILLPSFSFLFQLWLPHSSSIQGHPETGLTASIMTGSTSAGGITWSWRWSSPREHLPSCVLTRLSVWFPVLQETCFS